MQKVILVVGLHGSGKVSYAQSILEPGMRHFDDPGKMYWEMAEMKAYLKAGGSAVITDSYLLEEFTRSVVRETLTSLGVLNPTWIYFSNDPETCIQNLSIRKVTNPNPVYLQFQSDLYNIPAGATVLPVILTRITTLTVKRLSVCSCGFPALKETIPLGHEYHVNVSSVRDIWFGCGGCRQFFSIKGVDVLCSEDHCFWLCPYEVFLSPEAT